MGGGKRKRTHTNSRVIDAGGFDLVAALAVRGALLKARLGRVCLVRKPRRTGRGGPRVRFADSHENELLLVILVSFAEISLE